MYTRSRVWKTTQKKNMDRYYCDWHSLISLEQTAKENYLRIDEKLPGVTNYEAVKKYLQRLKNKPEKKYIFKNTPVVVETKTPGELKKEYYQKSIFNRHIIKIEDDQSDVCGFSYEDFSRMKTSCYQHRCNNCTDIINLASNVM